MPAPTPFVPDVQTFLTVIGRGLGQHAAKFPTWEALFTLTSEQLRELGIEPPRTRRHLLQWRQRFRRGQYGIGGDLRHVRGGVAELRVLETEREGDPVRRTRFVVNVPAPPDPAEEAGAVAGGKGEGEGAGEGEEGGGGGEGEGRGQGRGQGQLLSLKDLPPDQLSRVQGYKVKGARTIVGPYALPLKGEAGARVTVTEGMWEDRRGHKIDGGERRRTEIRYKKRIAERKEMREQGLL